MFARFAVLATMFACVIAPGTVRADDEFSRKGVYASIGALLAIENFGASDSHDLGGGFDLTLGYRANDVISLETEFEWAGIWQTPPEPGTNQGDINVYTWSANVKGNVPIGRFQPYALIGFGFHRSRVDRGMDSVPAGTETIDGMMKLGIGCDFYVTRHFALSPEVAYSALFNQKNNTDYIGVGVKAMYRF